MLAAPRICLCTKCQINFGSCSLFVEHNINMQQLEQINLRPIKNAIGAEEPEEGYEFPMFGTEMMPKDSIVALMAEQNYKEDPFYLITITDEEKEAWNDEKDKWGTQVEKGQMHLQGLFFQRRVDRKFELIKGKKAIFFRESVVWPQVILEAKKNIYTMENKEYVRIAMAIDNTLAYTPYWFYMTLLKRTH